MRSAHIVEIVTPEGIVLNGLWFGPLTPERVFIFVHGLTGSAFSMAGLEESLVDTRTAVLTFNNRGSEQVTSIKQKIDSGTKYLLAGAAHEVFAECVDDINGALRVAQESGAKEIFLAGHSTGAQKCIFWTSSGHQGVTGIILLGPLSDYSGALKTMDPEVLEKGVSHARALIAAGKPHELMPSELREWFACDAQRYISLYTPDTDEDIFPYAFPEKKPYRLESVDIPLLVLLAGADEYGDRPPQEIAAWFVQHTKTFHMVSIVPDVDHSFRNGETAIKEAVEAWLRSMKRNS